MKVSVALALHELTEKLASILHLLKHTQNLIEKEDCNQRRNDAKYIWDLEFLTWLRVRVFRVSDGQKSNEVNFERSLKYKLELNHAGDHGVAVT